jgi:hypothetical protein
MSPTDKIRLGLYFSLEKSPIDQVSLDYLVTQLTQGHMPEALLRQLTPIQILCLLRTVRIAEDIKIKILDTVAT